jgi:hypothetical protein
MPCTWSDAIGSLRGRLVQGMRISLTKWLGIANFSVWLRGFDVVRDSQFFV